MPFNFFLVEIGYVYKEGSRKKGWRGGCECHPQGNKAPPNEQVPLGGQVLFNTPILIDGEIMEAFQNMSQVMATQS